MKKIVSAIISAALMLVCGITTSAFDSSFTLSENNVSSLGGNIIYQPEQRIYALTQGETYSTELPVSEGLYVSVITGGYESASGNGSGDNGINSGCELRVECFDSDGNEITPAYSMAAVPADGAFYSMSIGKDDKYSGLPENTAKVRFTITASGNRQYLKSLSIISSDMKARDLSVREWEYHRLNNINANTTSAGYWIMVVFVFAVALIMFGVRKYRDKIRSRK